MLCFTEVQSLAKRMGFWGVKDEPWPIGTRARYLGGSSRRGGKL